MDEKQAIDRAIHYFEEINAQLSQAGYPGRMQDQANLDRFKRFFLLNLTTFFLGTLDIFDSEEQAISYHTKIVEITDQLKELVEKRDKINEKIYKTCIYVYGATIDTLDNPKLPLFKKLFGDKKDLMATVEEEILERLRKREEEEAKRKIELAKQKAIREVEEGERQRMERVK